MYELAKSANNLIFGIIVLVVGLAALVTPYDKYKERVRKAPPKAVLKVLGVMMIVVGVLCAVGIL